MLYKKLQSIEDHRRSQWKQFWLAEILYFSIIAIISWADSYRKISIFIKTHFDKLKSKYGLKWKKRPWYWTIRQILQWRNKEELERIFREYSIELVKLKEWEEQIVSLDWKVVRGSFDNFKDQKAIQIFSALLNTKIILAHEKIEEKTNEIPIAQKFFEELWLKNAIFTLDALHCQKKLLNK